MSSPGPLCVSQPYGRVSWFSQETRGNKTRITDTQPILWTISQVTQKRSLGQVGGRARSCYANADTQDRELKRKKKLKEKTSSELWTDSALGRDLIEFVRNFLRGKDHERIVNVVTRIAETQPTNKYWGFPLGRYQTDCEYITNNDTSCLGPRVLHFICCLCRILAKEKWFNVFDFY